MFLGEDLLAYLVLAFGGALFVGNLLAVIKPRLARESGNVAIAAPIEALGLRSLFSYRSGTLYDAGDGAALHAALRSLMPP